MDPIRPNQKLDELTVIMDHNKLQSDTFVARVSDLGDLEAKLVAFGWHVVRCDGNHVASFAAALSQANTLKVFVAFPIEKIVVSWACSVTKCYRS